MGGKPSQVGPVTASVSLGEVGSVDNVKAHEQKAHEGRANCYETAGAVLMHHIIALGLTRPILQTLRVVWIRKNLLLLPNPVELLLMEWKGKEKKDF